MHQISTRLLRRFHRVPLTAVASYNYEQFGYTPIKSRQTFSLPSGVGQQKWYPKHMAIQFEKMEARLRSVDLIVEVHDARIPLTGRNPEFQERLYSTRPHILVLNKRDLIGSQYCSDVEDYYRQKGINHILWTDCKHRRRKALSDLQALMTDCLRNDYRFNRAVRTEYLVMVVGIPNVGKSSIINSLRTTNLGKQQKAVREGARPGVTVRVQNRVRIMDNPPIYILDTPGVLNPHIRGVESAMKLGLCETILETTQERRHLADYLLFWLNKHQDYSYLKALRLDCSPTDDLNELLTNFCKSRDLRRKFLIPGKGYAECWDLDVAMGSFIDTFQCGTLADCFLDKDRL